VKSSWNWFIEDGIKK